MYHRQDYIDMGRHKDEDAGNKNQTLGKKTGLWLIFSVQNDGRLKGDNSRCEFIVENQLISKVFHWSVTLVMQWVTNHHWFRKQFIVYDIWIRWRYPRLMTSHWRIRVDLNIFIHYSKWRHMAKNILANNCSGVCLLPDGNKLYTEPMLFREGWHLSLCT